VLLASVLLVGILLTLVTVSLEAAIRGLRMQHLRVQASQALYLADAGRQRALSVLKKSGSWSSNGVEITLGDGSYEVTVTTPNPGTQPNRRRIAASGYLPRRANPTALQRTEQLADVVGVTVKGKTTYTVTLIRWQRMN